MASPLTRRPARQPHTRAPAPAREAQPARGDAQDSAGPRASGAGPGGAEPSGAGPGASGAGIREPRARRALGTLALGGLAAGSVATVAMAAQRPSFLTPTSRPGYFPAWMAGPLRGLWPGLTRSYDSLAWQASALMAAMFACYLLAYACSRSVRARWSVSAVVAVHVVFLLAPPLSYTDVFNYINYGRMAAVHHLDPYTTIPQLEPHSDPSFALSNWHFLLSPYGPLFTLLTEALVPLGVVASFWALKLMIGIASLATLALVWRCAVLLGRAPAPAVVFVGANPIFLVWGLGADHNDSLMLVCVMACVYMLLRSPARHRAGAMALVAGAMIKASAAVIAPILLVVAPTRRFARGALEASVALGAASLLAFGAHLPGLSTQSRLVTGIGLPNLLGLALGLGGETRGLHAAISVLVLACTLLCALWAHRRPADWLAACAAVLLVLIASLSWAAPWYLVWALPFAALACGRRLRLVTVALGVYFLLAFVPAAPMLAQAIHLNPETTRLGRQHRREIEALVR